MWKMFMSVEHPQLFHGEFLKLLFEDPIFNYDCEMF